MPFVCSVRAFVCYFAEHNSKVEIDLQLADLIVTFRTVMIENLCRLCQLRRIEKRKMNECFLKSPQKYFTYPPKKEPLEKHLRKKKKNPGDLTTPHSFIHLFINTGLNALFRFPSFSPQRPEGQPSGLLLRPPLAPAVAPQRPRRRGQPDDVVPLRRRGGSPRLAAAGKLQWVWILLLRQVDGA